MRWLALVALLSAAPAWAGPTALQIARRKLVEPTYDAKTLRSKVSRKPMRLGIGEFASYSGRAIERHQGEHERAQIHEHYREALSRLTDLDPDRKILGDKTWEQIDQQMTHGETKQARNTAEHLEFVVKDPEVRLHETRQMVEKVRGRLAAVLTAALHGKKPDPETLASVCEGLAKKYSFFDNPFRVEHFITDVRGLSPKLGRWDFSKSDPSMHVGKLPKKLQAVIKDLGHRVFKDVNVLFADHLYEDGVLTIDAMRAMGLDPENARFVTTPYPFASSVINKVQARGVQVAHAKYGKEETKAAVEKSIRELLEKARANHGPILVYDDGGMAAEVIAEKFADEMYRFKIVEITKAGERVAKATLPKKLGVDYNQLRNLTNPELQLLKERYLNATSWDGGSRKSAEQMWGEIERYIRTPSMRDVPPQNLLSSKVFGFAHYTYSDSKYKREVMTPLYTQAVNRAAFETIEHQGLKLKSNKVTIIGGGAMGLNAGLELREMGYEVTYVEPDDAKRKILETEHKFATSELKPALKGRAMVLELSGVKNLITAEHLFSMDDETFVLHGSSKDNPFDMNTIKALASETIAWKESPSGQRSNSYVFEAMGRKRTLHFPGDGFTISHRGAEQNVPLKKFVPEIAALLRLGAHAVSTPVTPTHYPFFGTPEWLMKPGAQKKAMREIKLDVSE